MLRKKTLLSVLLFGFVGFFAANFVSAGEIPSYEDNAKFLNEGIKHAEEAIAHADQGHGDVASEHIQMAMDALREIHSESWAPLIQRSIGKIRIAGIKAKKNDTEKAHDLLKQAMTYLKKVK